MQSIHPSLFVATVLLNLLMIRLGALLLPDSLYFSFSAFLFDNRDLVDPIALLVKLLFPFLVAGLVALALVWLQRRQAEIGSSTDRLERILSDQLPITAAFAAFAAALLMAWPYILLWDILIDPALGRHRLIFLLAYLAYFIGYACFGLAGANTVIAFSRSGTGEPLTWATLSQHPAVLPLVNAAGGLATAWLSTMLGSAAG